MSPNTRNTRNTNQKIAKLFCIIIIFIFDKQVCTCIILFQHNKDTNNEHNIQRQTKRSNNIS